MFVKKEPLNDRLQYLARQAQDIIPLLKTKEANSTSLPILSVYENPTSMREWYRQFMKEARNGDELWIWATNKTWFSVDPDFLKTFLAFKKRVGIRDLIIAPNTLESIAAARKIQDQQPHSEYRFADNPWMAAAEKWI